jgi:hypothetical protein
MHPLVLATAAALARVAPATRGTPRDLPSLVAHVDALPRPATLAAVLASFPPGLAVSATASAISLQPASGPDDPRIFVALGDPARPPALVVSFTPTLDTLEVDEVRADGRGEYGEIDFPVTGALEPADLARAILAAPGGDEGATRCTTCHGGEDVEVGRAGGVPRYALAHFRPDGDVPVAAVVALAAACERGPQASGERCRRLRAVARDARELRFPPW